MRTIGQIKEDLHLIDIGVVAEQARMHKKYGHTPAYAPSLADFTIASQQVEYLLREYPGYEWVIQVKDGVLMCANDTLARDYGFKLYTRMLDNDGKVIKKWAGGLLEKFRMREKFNGDHYLDAPKDLKGNVLKC